MEAFAEAAARVRSRSFTLDLARRATGEWVIVPAILAYSHDGSVLDLRVPLPSVEGTREMPRSPRLGCGSSNPYSGS